VISYQLRICPKGEPCIDYKVKANAVPIPRIGEVIRDYDQQRSWWVHSVTYDFERGYDNEPYVLVVARWNKP
jgi:hypothetical protein